MNTFKTYLALLLAPAAVGMVTLPGCSTAPPTEEAKQSLNDEAPVALNEMKRADPSLQDFLNKGYGYAIFPTIGAGGAGIGGAYGRGEVYEQGKKIGYADLSQGTIGLELGGRTYSELIVFKDKDALDHFRNNNFELAAHAAAVAIKSGRSTARTTATASPSSPSPKAD